MKKSFLLLFVIFTIFLGQQLCAETSKYDDDESPEIDRQIKVDVEGIQLRPIEEIEQAVMEYLLAFEAYKTARKSEDDATRANMVRYMKQYREAYANFLSIMRQDRLFDPQKPKNPAGWYNKKHKKDKGVKKEWKTTAATDFRKLVKGMVEKGATPKEIKEKIKELAQQSSCATIAGSSTGSAGGGDTGDDNDSDGKDRDKDDDDEEEDDDKDDDDKDDNKDSTDKEIAGGITGKGADIAPKDD